MVQECLAEDPPDTVTVTAALRGDRQEPESAIAAAAALHAAGAHVDWVAVNGEGRRTPLPTYAFQRRRYWLDQPPAHALTHEEAALWAAVEDRDPAGLLAALGLPDDDAPAVAVLLPALARLRTRADPTPAPEHDESGLWRERLAAADDEDRDQVLTELVLTGAAAVLGLGTPAELDTLTPFADVGFTSFTALELRNLLCGQTGLTVPLTAVYDFPTVADLVAYLRAELIPTPTPTRGVT
jgi:acyl transferase domain-containing protein